MTKVFQIITVGFFLSLFYLSSFTFASDPMQDLRRLNQREIVAAKANISDLTNLLEQADSGNIDKLKPIAIHKFGNALDVLDNAISVQKNYEMTSEALSKQKLISYIGIPLMAIVVSGFFIWYMNYKKQFQMGMPMVEDDE